MGVRLRKFSGATGEHEMGMRLLEGGPLNQLYLINSVTCSECGNLLDFSESQYFYLQNGTNNNYPDELL